MSEPLWSHAQLDRLRRIVATERKLLDACADWIVRHPSERAGTVDRLLRELRDLRNTGDDMPEREPDHAQLDILSRARPQPGQAPGWPDAVKRSYPQLVWTGPDADGNVTVALDGVPSIRVAGHGRTVLAALAVLAEALTLAAADVAGTASSSADDRRAGGA